MISNICVHHSGGTQNNPQASTLYLTPEDIARYHKEKWNSPGEYLDTPLKDAGYNAIYDPKTRLFHQCRALGEETIAQAGHNLDTFSLCIIGNYNYLHGTDPKQSVDPMSNQIEQDVAVYLYDLIANNKRGLVLSLGAFLSFSVKRIYAHRFFSDTNCYGTFLENNWAQELVIRYKKPPVVIAPEQVVYLKKRLSFLQKILRLYVRLFDLRNKIKLRKQSLGAIGDRECTGIVG